VLVVSFEAANFLDEFLFQPLSVPSLQPTLQASGAQGLVDESSGYHKMMKQIVCFAAVILWVVTVVAAGWFFVKGWTAIGSDGRTEIILAPAERDQILEEMRQLLKAVDGVIRELAQSEPDLKRMASAARAVGMHMAADVEPAIMVKLPLPFKQLGMSIHNDMDALADAITQNETPPQILKRLSSMTARCTACHDMYRFKASE
jgi:cytochrome c556